MKVEELAARVTTIDLALSNEAIESFERSTGYDFPEDYRSFLRMIRGGGEVSLGSVEYLEFKKSKMTYNPSVFCSPGTGEYHHIRSLQRHFEDLEHSVADVPDGIFTIADDMMGNFLTIDLRRDSFGQIGVVDHETIGDNFYDPETYEVLAQSFSDFAKSCKVTRDIYLFKIQDAEAVEITDSGQLRPLVERAESLGKIARLEDRTGGWKEFHPKGKGGHMFQVFSGDTVVRQTYYPGNDRADPTIIDTDHVIQCFRYFLGGVYLDLDIRTREVS